MRDITSKTDATSIACGPADKNLLSESGEHRKRGRGASSGALCGRAGEQATLVELIEDVQSGRSGALVIRGEAGIGKSALLEYGVRRAGGTRVLRATGVEAETALPFASLQMLLRPVLNRLDALPDAQSSALRGALGLASGDSGDRFLVGLAVLTLLSELAEQRPVLCLIDDAQWLDAASAESLLFAARRVGEEAVGVVFASRSGFEAPGLRELPLHGLEPYAAAGLLLEHAPDLAAHPRERILEEAAGNPLALRELSAGLSPEQRAGRTTLPGALPVTQRVLDLFSEQIDRLPEMTRLVLLVTAAEGSGKLATVLEAAQTLGASAKDFDLAHDADLLRIAGLSVAFRHPLIRSAAYQHGPLTARLAAHEALANVLDGDRAVWHRAAAATAPDERIAAALEQVAESARARGALASAALVFERAAGLTPGEAPRARRATLAAQSAITAGRTGHAAALTEHATALSNDPLHRAGLAMVAATVEFEHGRPRGASQILIDSAEPIVDDDPELALTLLIIAAENTWAAGEQDAAKRVARVAATVPANGAVKPALVALGTFISGDYARAAPALQALTASAREDPPEGLIARMFVTFVALLLGDDEAALRQVTADVARSRARGMAGALPRALQSQAQALVMAGLHADATAAVSEALTLARDTDQRHRSGRLLAITARIAAIEGDEDRCRELARAAGASTALENPADRWGSRPDHLEEAIVAADCALGLLDLGHGRYDTVVRRLEEAARGPARHTSAVLSSMADLVEAAVRVGQPQRARLALTRFDAWAEAGGTPWATAVALRCHALMSASEQAGELYAQAARTHEAGGRPFERARTLLAYGEWLRRARRRADAREPLRTALEIFSRLDASPWADRALGELRATGETIGARGDCDLLSDLTPQELLIVRLAAGGASNRDIAAQLFLSHRTVEYHLYKAYPKLGIISRTELARYRLS